MKEIKLRDYQHECTEIINNIDPGAYLIQMATGLGKTVTFSRIARKGKMLILSHREELVRQPLKYFDCLTGVEMAGNHASPMDEVVSASVQTMTHRLERFAPDEFDIIVCDEAHHSSARTYRRIFDYFTPRLLLGFTATPNRSDNVRLNDVYSDIIFQRDLKWGIKNGYLSDIYCRRVNIGYDLRGVHSRGGDYAPGELEKAMDGTADAIAETYRTMATGATLIFAVSVQHANDIAAKIPGAVVVTGETKDRASIIQAFTGGKIPCIVSVNVFLEGTDLPLVETIIVARPTKSDSLYTQLVGRGLRLFPGKKHLNLIDCVGVTNTRSLCTAPSLLGISVDDIPERKISEIEGLLFELPEKAIAASDCPESWVRNWKVVDLWAQTQKYNLHDINFFQLPNGDMTISIPDKKIIIPAQDELGMTVYNGRKMNMQQAIDLVFIDLQHNHSDSEYIWNLTRAKRWANSPASNKQLSIIQKRLKGFDTSSLNKFEASQILNRLFAGKKKRGVA